MIAQTTFPFEDFESSFWTNRRRLIQAISNHLHESKSSMGKVVSANASCENIEENYTFTCDNRYISNGNECDDDNECELNTHNCDANARCSNIDNSFTYSCNDVNECQKSPCNKNVTCENTVCSYTCSCINGFKTRGTTCVDINDFTAGLHQCDDQASCMNLIGSYNYQCSRVMEFHVLISMSAF